MKQVDCTWSDHYVTDFYSMVPTIYPKSTANLGGMATTISKENGKIIVRVLPEMA